MRGGGSLTIESPAARARSVTAVRQVRLGADIGGTFTDVVLEVDGKIHSTKALTTHAAPEQAILDGVAMVTKAAGVTPADLDIVIHGATLATNALIERRGARTAFVTTEGFRDVLEMRSESRFEQYDLNLRLPPPLIAREHRFPIAGRIGARGQELKPLDEAALASLADRLRDEKFEVGRDRLHPCLHEPRPRAARARHPGAQGFRADFDLGRSLAADARIRALQHRLRQRLCPAADGRLPRAAEIAIGGDGGRMPGLPHPLRRRSHLGRNGGRVSGSPRRIRAGRRRDLRRRHRAKLRPRQGRFLRHGRHDGENLPDRRLRAANLARLRGRAGLSLLQGIGNANLDSGHRDDRDRGRRRLDRLDRRDGPHPDRPGKRGFGARARLLSARRDAADDHRRRPRARQDRPRQFRRRRDPIVCREGGGGDLGPCRRAPWPDRARPPPSASRKSSTRTWRTRRACTPSRAARTSRTT